MNQKYLTSLLFLALIASINCDTRTNYVVNTQPNLYDQKGIIIRNYYSYQYGVGCDDQTDYLWYADADSIVIKISYEERQNAGCTDSKFNLGILPSQSGYYQVEFLTEDWYLQETFVLDNKNQIPTQVPILRNIIYLESSYYSRRGYEKYQYTTNTHEQSMFFELMICDAKQENYKIYSVVDDDFESKTEIQPYKDNYYAYSGTGNNMSLFVSMSPDEEPYRYFYTLKYQNFEPGSKVNYDQFQVNGNLVFEVDDDQLELHLPRITSTLPYSYIQYLAVFSYDSYSKLISCSMGDQIPKSYLQEMEIISQFQNDNSNEIEEENKIKYKGTYNYTSIYARAYVGGQAITIPIGNGSFQLEQKNNTKTMTILAITIMCVIICAALFYYLYRCHQKRKIMRDQENQLVG